MFVFERNCWMAGIKIRRSGIIQTFELFLINDITTNIVRWQRRLGLL